MPMFLLEAMLVMLPRLNAEDTIRMVRATAIPAMTPEARASELRALAEEAGQRQSRRLPKGEFFATLRGMGLAVEIVPD